MPTGQTEPAALTIPFEKFWAWLQNHSNCILRAGTPDILLFDHEDYHWHLGAEDESVLLVQLIRGKELVAEMVLLSGDISYVQIEPGGGGEVGDGGDHIFECVIEGESAREVAYQFVLAHGYDEADPPRRTWTH